MQTQLVSTERREFLNRAFRALHGSYGVLMCAEDERTLFQEICRVMVEEAGYRLAWIGLSSPDTTKTIEFVAEAGFGQSDVDSLNLCFASTPRASASTANAIHTSKPNLTRLGPQSTKPRHVSNQSPRIASVLSLPMRVEGGVIAALGIAARESDAFGEHEIELLTRAVDYLAFGIGTLRAKARHNQAEQEIQLLNRALSTRVAVNHALIHATDEEELLQDICRVLVKQCNYRLAWVGYRASQLPISYQPVAHQGFEAGFLAIGVSWESTAEGMNFMRGLDALLDSGHPLVMRDILSDPTAPLREEALQRGYAAAIFLPLRAEGALIGVLVISAAEAEAFDEKEVDLLLATANDLGFGIATLRTRARAAEAEAAVHRMAYTDVLTGLPNRVRLYELIEEAIAAARQDRRALGVLQLEVGRNQEINETLGYQETDRLHQEIATRLVQAAGPGQPVARVSDCEFAVLMPSGGAEQASQLAQKILATLHEPIELSGLLLDASPSIGIALYPGHGTNADALVRRAAGALSQAKRDCVDFSLYQGGLDQECAQHLTLMCDLRRAIEHNELFLQYQPKLDIATHRVCGSEALVRWQHPQQGMLSPATFIKLAESTGLITLLTYWVLDTALGQSYAWHEEGDERPISVNLSARDLRDPKLLERIRGAFATWGARPDWIEFELTESALMEDPVAALEILQKLKSLDIRLTIDDFGTGYSSLAYLQKLPVDVLKIDQSFVTRLLSDDDDSAKIVRSIIELAHNLDLQVVAEGVESRETLERLARFGCDIAQGYSISRPLLADQFHCWEAGSAWH